MIDREEQVITSDYQKCRKIPGLPDRSHYALDLRNWDDEFKHRLNVVLPEDAIFKDAIYEEEWGWTYIFTPLVSGRHEIRFTHLSGNMKFAKGASYPKGMIIGQNMVTQYMTSKKLGEHLHFAVKLSDDVYEDPKIYYKELGIKFRYATRKA